MSHVVAGRLSNNEFERFAEICRRFNIGTSTGVKLALLAFLNDPLPEEGERILAELYDVQRER